MRFISRSWLGFGAAVALALAPNVAAAAETPREELVHAYVLLSIAKHDYAGHRVLAMHELEEAGHDLGLVLRGEGAAHERQMLSDAQLVEARRLLRHARGKLEKRDRERAAARVDHAIKEINIALKVR